MLIETPTDTNPNDAIGRAARTNPATMWRTDLMTMLTSLRSLTERRLNAAETTTMGGIYTYPMERGLNGVVDPLDGNGSRRRPAGRRARNGRSASASASGSSCSATLSGGAYSATPKNHARP